MKRKKMMLTAAIAIALTSGIVLAADHLDAPGVTGSGNTSLDTDITDIYAFQSPSNNANMVFVMTWQGLMSPSQTATVTIPSNELFEFNIDNNSDNVEDLVIQAKVQDGKFRVYGPVAPTVKGTTSTILTSGPMVEGTVTSYASSSTPAVATSSAGIKAFIGPRDDPFFFDLTRFKEILGGTQAGFRNPGVDAFAGTNVLALVVEVPKSMLGSAATLNVWGEIKTK